MEPDDEVSEVLPSVRNVEDAVQSVLVVNLDQLSDVRRRFDDAPAVRGAHDVISRALDDDHPESRRRRRGKPTTERECDGECRCQEKAWPEPLSVLYQEQSDSGTETRPTDDVRAEGANRRNDLSDATERILRIETRAVDVEELTQQSRLQSTWATLQSVKKQNSNSFLRRHFLSPTNERTNERTTDGRSSKTNP